MNNETMNIEEPINNMEDVRKRDHNILPSILIGITLLATLVGFIVGYNFGLNNAFDMIENIEATENTTITEDTVNTMPTETTEPTVDVLPTTPETVPTETEPEVTVPTETEPEVTVPTETEPEVTVPPETTPEATTAPVIEETVSTYEMSEREMLACVIYQEAGGDAACDDCRRRVADVVLNRVSDPRFPDTIYGVLTAYAQYGRFYWTGIVWPERANNAGEKHAVERAYRIADEVLAGQHSELYGKGYVFQAEFQQGSDNIYCCGHYFGK